MPEAPPVTSARRGEDSSVLRSMKLHELYRDSIGIAHIHGLRSLESSRGRDYRIGNDFNARCFEISRQEVEIRNSKREMGIPGICPAQAAMLARDVLVFQQFQLDDRAWDF